MCTLDVHDDAVLAIFDQDGKQRKKCSFIRIAKRGPKRTPHHPLLFSLTSANSVDWSAHVPGVAYSEGYYAEFAISVMTDDELLRPFIPGNVYQLESIKSPAFNGEYCLLGITNDGNEALIAKESSFLNGGVLVLPQRDELRICSFRELTPLFDHLRPDDGVLGWLPRVSSLARKTNYREICKQLSDFKRGNRAAMTQAQARLVQLGFRVVEDEFEEIYDLEEDESHAIDDQDALFDQGGPSRRLRSHTPRGATDSSTQAAVDQEEDEEDVKVTSKRGRRLRSPVPFASPPRRRRSTSSASTPSRKRKEVPEVATLYIESEASLYSSGEEEFRARAAKTLADQSAKWEATKGTSFLRPSPASSPAFSPVAAIPLPPPAAAPYHTHVPSVLPPAFRPPLPQPPSASWPEVLAALSQSGYSVVRTGQGEPLPSAGHPLPLAPPQGLSPPRSHLDGLASILATARPQGGDVGIQHLHIYPPSFAPATPSPLFQKFCGFCGHILVNGRCPAGCPNHS